MADIKHDQIGSMGLLLIHSRVERLCLDENEDLYQFKYRPLCDYCEMKLDMSGGKRGNELEVD